VTSQETGIGTPVGPEARPDAGVEQETTDAFDRTIAQLEAVKAPAAAGEGLRALARQIGQPCVIAVVGQVNAGKSTFINALLEDDKAVVGSTETTATINHFVFGEPNPERPVHCHWRGGRVTEETSDFLDSLQGKDLETLERAEGIDRLEYLLPYPMLRTVTIVDTPGTGAVVGEHGTRTAEFLELAQRLRERHDAETVRIHDTADAIVYLVGAVARTSDQELLDQFVRTSSGGARAMNALGVIAKVDLSPALMERRHELAAKIGRQLEAQLNDVIPVSAALARAIDRLHQDNGRMLERLVETVRRIPASQLELLLENEELFCEYEPPGCPVPAADRRALRQAVPSQWRVFATIVNEARTDSPPAEVAARLGELAGFDRLRRTLQEHFLERAAILRCYRITHDARALLQKLWYSSVIPLRRRTRAQETQLERFLAFVDRSGGDPEVALELRAYLRGQLDVAGHAEQLEAAWKDVDLRLSGLLRRLEEHNADFNALQVMEGAASAFSPEEAEELRALLGMYGTDTRRRLRGHLDPAGCVDRQLRWRIIRDRAPRNSPRWMVADRAHSRLGLILDELEPSPISSAR
jgi:GTPase SAR1 family protein